MAEDGRLQRILIVSANTMEEGSIMERTPKSNIVIERERAGLSRDELAAKLGILEPTMHSIEDEPSSARGVQLLAMSRLFDCTIEYLVGGEASKPGTGNNTAIEEGKKAMNTKGSNLISARNTSIWRT